MRGPVSLIVNGERVEWFYAQGSKPRVKTPDNESSSRNWNRFAPTRKYVKATPCERQNSYHARRKAWDAKVKAALDAMREQALEGVEPIEGESEDDYELRLNAAVAGIEAKPLNVSALMKNGEMAPWSIAIHDLTWQNLPPHPGSLAGGKKDAKTMRNQRKRNRRAG